MTAEAHRTLRLGVVGAGYVGLVTAACLAHRGHEVTVLEIDPTRLAALRVGRVPFHEPGVQELVDDGHAAGRLIATDVPAALAGADAVLVCVGTPLDGDGNADLSQVESACRMIARTAPNTTVVVRSTLPLGTTERLAEWLERNDLSRVVTNPEFLRQGSAVADFGAPTRIVIGTHHGLPSPASRLVELIHAAPAAPVLVTDFATADMIKNAANAFLATKLSFINEVADLCEAYGADVETVAEGIGLDPRIGRSYLRPGIGFGGSCLPKELANLTQLGERRGLPVTLLHAASHENGHRIERICARLDELSGGLAGRRVGLLGLSFKPDTDDLRHSPALALARAMLARGARVIAHDPAVPFERTADVRGLRRSPTPDGALRGAELVVLATEWSEYRDLDWSAMRTLAARPLLFDGRNALDGALLAELGWTVAGIGRPTDDPIGLRRTRASAGPVSDRADSGARGTRERASSRARPCRSGGRPAS